MQDITLKLDKNLYDSLSVICSRIRVKKDSFILKLVKDYIENEENKNLALLTKKRIKRIKSGKAKLITHEEFWKSA